MSALVSLWVIGGLLSLLLIQDRCLVTLHGATARVPNLVKSLKLRIRIHVCGIWLTNKNLELAVEITQA